MPDNSQNNRYVGVIFVNYRTQQISDKSNEKLMKSFASLASIAIYNAYLLDENKKFWETRRRDSFALSVSEIVSGLAHNSGNLVTSIMLPFSEFLHELEKKYKNKTQINKDFVENFISKIKEPLNELDEDFNRLKEYRKFDEFNIEEHTAIALIENSIKLLNNKFQKQKVQIKRSMQEDAKVLCDSTQIQHLFLNLFINAVDAMGKRGGELSLGTKITDAGDMIRVRVSDNGSGISNEDRTRIFQPFFTTKQKRGGTGLGLPISKYIAEIHGGHIEIDHNSTSKGASFLVFLPIYKGGKKT